MEGQGMTRGCFGFLRLLAARRIFEKGAWTRCAIGAYTAVCIASAFGQASAQTYPDRPIRIVVPFTAGSPNDVVARVISQPLSVRLGQPVVVENRPGGGTLIGIRSVLSAERDGYTLLQSSSPTVFLNSLVNENTNFDPFKDIVPISTIGSTALVMVVTPDVPAKSLNELVAYSKANPEKLSIGYGRGTLPNLSSELLKWATKAELASIPYRGGAQVVADMLGGRIQINLGSPATLLPLIRDGRLRAVAVTSPNRMIDLPDVPTMKESGHPDVVGTNHWGLFGPAGMPVEIIRKLNAEIAEILKSPDFQEQLRKIGAEPGGGSPEDFAAILQQELKVWAPIVKATGFRLE
jgi:tripartite-type tricarboxylate transporter receptor subunit TctC